MMAKELWNHPVFAGATAASRGVRGGVSLAGSAVLRLLLVWVMLSAWLVPTAESASGFVPLKGRIMGPSFAYVGDTVRLRCPLPANHKSTLGQKWIFPDSIYLWNRRGRFIARTIHEFSLTMRYASVNDTGWFSCARTYLTQSMQPFNKLGSHFLQILPRPLSPPPVGHGKLFLVAAPAVAVMGHDLMVACAVRGISSTAFAWSCTGVNLTTSQRAAYNADNGWLTVKNVTATDAGNCTCKAGNERVSFSFSVASRFAQPTHVTVNKDKLEVAVGLPEIGYRAPSACSMKFKFQHAKIERQINCSALPGRGLKHNVYFRLLGDFFAPNESSILERALGHRVEIKVAIAGLRTGRHSKQLLYLPHKPILPERHGFLFGAFSPNGTMTVTIPAPSADQRTAGVSYLPVAEYDLYYCFEDASRERCTENRPAVWVFVATQANRHNPEGVEFTLENITGGHTYRPMIVAQTVPGLEFSMVSGATVAVAAPAVTVVPTTIPPPPTDAFRHTNVLTAFSLERRYSCSAKEPLSNEDLAEELHNYFKGICQCNITGADASYLVVIPKINCSSTSLRGLQEISYEFYLNTSQCVFLDAFYRKMWKLRGLVSISRRPAFGTTTFKNLCMDTSVLPDGCPQVHTKQFRDSTTGEVFTCISDFKLPPPTPSTRPITPPVAIEASPVTPGRPILAVTQPVIPGRPVLAVTQPDHSQEPPSEIDLEGKKESNTSNSTNIVVTVTVCVVAAIVVLALVGCRRRFRSRSSAPAPPDPNMNFPAERSDQNNNSGMASHSSAHCTSSQQSVRGMAGSLELDPSICSQPPPPTTTTRARATGSTRSASVEYISTIAGERCNMPPEVFEQRELAVESRPGSPLRQSSITSASWPSLVQVQSPTTAVSSDLPTDDSPS